MGAMPKWVESNKKHERVRITGVGMVAASGGGGGACAGSRRARVCVRAYDSMMGDSGMENTSVPRVAASVCCLVLSWQKPGRDEARDKRE